MPALGLLYLPSMGEPGQPLPPCPHCRAAHPEDLLVCPNTNRLLELPGRVLDSRFRFIKKLGEGGMSTVWMAENFRVRKRVAIKIMHPEYARNPRTLRRFQNEATAAGRIGNPHICDILDLGESPLGPYIVMEMLQGSDFGGLLEEQGRIDPPLAALIICEAVKGLIAAHAAGIIHRDLKPENVFLHEPEPGRMLVKLMDFGISKFADNIGGGRTGANVVMGTPEYMAPEQAAGAANVDARTDIWAMGVMLYRALAGVEPFRGKTMAALLLALSTEDHPPLSSFAPELHPGLIAVVDRCLAKEPQYRYASAQELFAALAPYQQAVAAGERPQAPVRTGKTMAISVAQMPKGPPPGASPSLPGATVVSASRATPALRSTPGSHETLDTTGPTGSVPTLPPQTQHPTQGSSGSGSTQQGNAGTWSTELTPSPGPGQSWSMGQRTFSEQESRPYTPTKKEGGRGWIGGLIALGIVALLGGGAALAWSQGWLDLGNEQGGDERGVTSEGDGSDAQVATEAGDAVPDLPGAGASGSDDGTGDTATEGETGEETEGETGDAATTGGGTDTGGDSGGDPEQPIRIEFGNLIRQGSLYTHKSRGPNGTWTSAKGYCRSLKRKQRYGLTKWRMATVAELQKFRSSEVDRLLYWSRDSDGRNAQAVSMMSGKAGQRKTSDPAPRAFCVSRK